MSLMGFQDRVREINARVGIGPLAVGLAFAAMVTTTIGMVWFGWPAWLQAICLAGFIGGFTDSVAIHMLFTRSRFLPGSGVLLNQRDAIIRSLADTMEAHILNPSLIEAKVQALAAEIDRERLARIANAVLDEIRPDLVAYLNAPEQRAQITAAVRREGGFWGDMAHALGVVTYDTVAERICAGLADHLRQATVDQSLIDRILASVGSIDDFLLRPGNPIVQRHYGGDRSILQLIFAQLDAKQLVIERLSTYDATQIRDIIAANVREHLAWLQVFGVLLGMLLAAIVEVLVVVGHAVFPR